MDKFGPEKWHPVTAKEVAEVALGGLKWVFNQLHHEGLSDRFKKPHNEQLNLDDHLTEMIYIDSQHNRWDDQGDYSDRSA